MNELSATDQDQCTVQARSDSKERDSAMSRNVGLSMAAQLGIISDEIVEDTIVEFPHDCRCSDCGCTRT